MRPVMLSAVLISPHQSLGVVLGELLGVMTIVQYSVLPTHKRSKHFGVFSLYCAQNPVYVVYASPHLLLGR